MRVEWRSEEEQIMGWIPCSGISDSKKKQKMKTKHVNPQKKLPDNNQSSPSSSTLLSDPLSKIIQLHYPLDFLGFGD